MRTERLANPMVLFVLLIAVGGCADYQSNYRGFTDADARAAEEAARAAAHDHAHVAPHGGTLFELGDHEYCAEFLLDAGSRTLTVHLLDAHAENAVAIPEPEIEFHLESGAGESLLTLHALPSPGETGGRSSRFVASGESLPPDLRTTADVRGHLHVSINGKTFECDTAAHDHGHGTSSHTHAHDNE